MLATHPLWLLLALAAAVIARLAYTGTAMAASAYGRTIEAAFDLHRFDLLAALHLPLPADSAAERSANETLSAFVLADARTADVHYAHASGMRGDDGRRPV